MFLVMNLERWLLVPFLRLVKWFCSKLHSPTICIWAVARGTEDGSVLSVPVLQVTHQGASAIGAIRVTNGRRITEHTPFCIT